MIGLVIFGWVASAVIGWWFGDRVLRSIAMIWKGVPATGPRALVFFTGFPVALFLVMLAFMASATEDWAAEICAALIFGALVGYTLVVGLLALLFVRSGLQSATP